jgi:hypothetical protein
MKITIQKAEEQKPESKYPYFGIYEEGMTIIVLFTGIRTGTLVSSSNGNATLGEVRTDWSEHNYKPFNGTIKIEQ